MAYQNYQQEDETKLAWDLRQFYTRFVAIYMLRFKEAEDNEDYPNMLKCLDKWCSTIKHEWSENKKDEEYLKLREKLIEAARKYKNTFFKKEKNEQGVFEIESALGEIKEYLMAKMKEAGMFGSEWNDDGI